MSVNYGPHEARVDAGLDQSWADMRAELGDVQRIALRLQTQRELDPEEDLIRRCLLLITAELYARARTEPPA